MFPSSPHSPSGLRRPAALRPLVWLLVLVLCLASTLGLMHRVLHSPEGVHGMAGVTPHPHHADAAEPCMRHGESHGLIGIFGGHDDGDPQCRLYDQLAHGSALPSVVAPMLPVVLPTPVLNFMQGEALVRRVLLFDARGPPAFR